MKPIFPKKHLYILRFSYLFIFIISMPIYAISLIVVFQFIDAPDFKKFVSFIPCLLGAMSPISCLIFANFSGRNFSKKSYLYLALYAIYNSLLAMYFSGGIAFILSVISFLK